MYRIAVTGPESTGKSELTKALADHFGCPFVPEFAREYVEKLHRPYAREDVEIIARKQIEFENEYLQNNQFPYVIFDTELIITKVWFQYCYGEVPEFVQKQLESGFFDLYLLCEPDLPWIPDPVREHGDDREYFFELYRSEIVQLGKPYQLISGIGEERTDNAIKAVEAFCKMR
jgi:nicotinamide riboside kinase